VFEYEITSNRVDCYSVVGIAREAAATFGKEFHPPVVKPTGNNEDINDYLKVRVENPELCPRYCARMVKNIKLAPSPEWMQRRLGAPPPRGEPRPAWRPAESAPSTTSWTSPTT